jgi:hypothetical protein
VRLRALVDKILLRCITNAAYDAPMPATNPRLTITLKPSTAAQMRRLSELTGNSQSAIISELLEANSSVFERLILVLQAATDAKDAMATDIAGGMRDAQSKLEAQLGLMLEELDSVTSPLLEEAERIKRRGRRGAVPSGTPVAVPKRLPTPISNRGVRSHTKTPKKATGSRS